MFVSCLLPSPVRRLGRTAQLTDSGTGCSEEQWSKNVAASFHGTFLVTSDHFAQRDLCSESLKDLASIVWRLQWLG